MHEYLRPVFAESGELDGADVVGDEADRVRQERYRPVHSVAQALIEHVDREYDVHVDAPVALPSGHAHSLGHDVSRIVRIASGRPGEVTVWVVFGTEPGVLSVFAGFFSQFDLWFCGCEVCDEPWEEIAGSLEEVVLGLAGGGVAESLGPGRSGRARWALTRWRRDWSGTVPSLGVRRRERHRWEDQLAQLPDGRWSGWTVRADADGHAVRADP